MPAACYNLQSRESMALAAEGELSMLYLDFSRKAGLADAPRFVLGPYVSAQIVKGRLWVVCHRYDDQFRNHFEAFLLAHLEESGWTVHDGMGDVGPMYEAVSFRSEETPDEAVRKASLELE
jgi:hypothetical protein